MFFRPNAFWFIISSQELWLGFPRNLQSGQCESTTYPNASSSLSMENITNPRSSDVKTMWDPLNDRGSVEVTDGSNSRRAKNKLSVLLRSKSPVHFAGFSARMLNKKGRQAALSGKNLKQMYAGPSRHVFETPFPWSLSTSQMPVIRSAPGDLTPSARSCAGVRIVLSTSIECAFKLPLPQKQQLSWASVVLPGDQRPVSTRRHRQ